VTEIDPRLERTVGKFIALVLRHDPTKLGLTLDDQGWADLGSLCAGLQQKFGLERPDVLALIARDGKSRYRIDGNRIRANQGHSLDVDLGLTPVDPPHDLFHGTTREALDPILREGLQKRQRTHVHLSGDIETARLVAARRKHGTVLLVVAAGAMQAAGYQFYQSDNGVWLTDNVPPNYLRVMAPLV
jgi:putative RNA 2'-phosphotransferase